MGKGTESAALPGSANVTSEISVLVAADEKVGYEMGPQSRM